MNKPTLVLGASPTPHRYSNLATRELLRHGHDVMLIGKRRGEIIGIPIGTTWVNGQMIDTITMYLSAQNQVMYYDDILSSRAKRIIFNPGAENKELANLVMRKGIKAEDACTLVLLATNQY
jgi:predicted CoA-binding protein